MKGMMGTQRKKPVSEINVVPYIDVMLVLLIIFMVTAPMMTQGVKVDLPQTSSDPITSEKELPPIIVSVDTSGSYFLEVGENASQPMPLAELQGQIAIILEQRPDGEVLVRGDQLVSYGKVVELMAALQAAGASGVGLITDQPRPE